MSPHNEKQIITIVEAAELLCVCTRTIRRLTSEGLIPSIRITGKIIRYDRLAIEKALVRLSTAI